MKKIFVLFFLLVSACAFTETNFNIFGLNIGDTRAECVYKLYPLNWLTESNLTDDDIWFENRAGILDKLKTESIELKFEENPEDDSLKEISVYFENMKNSDVFSKYVKSLYSKYNCSYKEETKDVFLYKNNKGFLIFAIYNAEKNMAVINYKIDHE